MVAADPLAAYAEGWTHGDIVEILGGVTNVTIVDWLAPTLKTIRKIGMFKNRVFSVFRRAVT